MDWERAQVNAPEVEVAVGSLAIRAVVQGNEKVDVEQEKGCGSGETSRPRRKTALISPRLTTVGGLVVGGEYEDASEAYRRARALRRETRASSSSDVVDASTARIT